jgi:general secretion pathway protein C
MSFDRIARKSFGFIVALLLGVAIYFQASGAVELLASQVLVDPAPAANSKLRRPKRTRTVTHPQVTSGDPILSRNPFDSVTGPIDRNAVPVNLPEAAAAAKNPLDLTDPLRAPECDDVLVDIVSQSPDAAWSLAQLKGPGDTDYSTRRVGDTVGKLKVAYIGFNAEKGSPAVWLMNSDKLCQALLFSDKSQKEKETAAAAPAAAAPRPAPVAPAQQGGVPPEIASKIQKVSETEFNIDRSVVDNILENQAQLMRSARIVPEQKDGKTVGIRLFGIRSDTLLGTLGLQNGDRLEKINGFEIANPEKALEAYARLRTATELTMDVTRRGKSQTMSYHIK